MLSVVLRVYLVDQLQAVMLVYLALRSLTLQAVLASVAVEERTASILNLTRLHGAANDAIPCVYIRGTISPIISYTTALRQTIYKSICLARNLKLITENVMWFQRSIERSSIEYTFLNVP